MLKFIVKLKYNFKNYKHLFEFIRRISCYHRCNYGLYSVVSHGALLAAAAQLSLKCYPMVCMTIFLSMDCGL